MVNNSVLSGIDQVAIRSAGGHDKLGIGLIRKIDDLQVAIEPESFPFFAFCLVLRGRGEYVDWETKKHYPLRENHYFLRLPGVVHQLRIDPESDWLECFINLGYNLYPCFRAFCGVSAENPTGEFIPGEAWLKRFLELIPEIQHSPEGCLMEMLPPLLALVAEAVRRIERDDRTIAQVKEAGRCLCADFRTPCDIREFCRRQGWGYESFRKKFAEVTGMAPHQYRSHHRNAAARALLLQRTLTVADISKELGYCSAQEFAAAFKRRNGMTPTEFRNSNHHLME